MFDKPVEEATEWLFYNAFKAIGGEQAVGERQHGHHHKDTLKASDETKKEL
jgi:mitochondrial fission process protein 1